MSLPNTPAALCLGKHSNHKVQAGHSSHMKPWMDAKSERWVAREAAICEVRRQHRGTEDHVGPRGSHVRAVPSMLRHHTGLTGQWLLQTQESNKILGPACPSAETDNLDQLRRHKGLTSMTGSTPSAGTTPDLLYQLETKPSVGRGCSLEAESHRIRMTLGCP